MHKHTIHKILHYGHKTHFVSRSTRYILFMRALSLSCCNAEQALQ